MRDVVVAGTLCADLIPALGEVPALEPGRLFDAGPLTLRPGGCVANTGAALAGLGLDVALAGAVGEDDLGRVLVAALARSGADASGVRAVPGAATSYSLVFDAPGWDRTFVHHGGANERFDGSDLPDAQILHLGYPFLLPALCGDDGAGLERVLVAAHRAGTVTSLDLATGTGALDLAARRRLLERALPHVDVFTPSRDDLVAALGGSVASLPPAELARHALALGPAAVLLKLGCDGVLLVTAGPERLARAGGALAGIAAAWAGVQVAAPSRAVAVAGTTGAGDAAAAGLLASLLRGRPPERAAQVAAAAGSVAVEGGAMPVLEGLEARLGSGWPALEPATATRGGGAA